MRLLDRAAAVFFVCVLVAGCSSSSTDAGTSAPASNAPATPPAAAPSVAQLGVVNGKVPAAAGVIVVLEPKGEHTPTPQPEVPAMDQVSLTFTPDMLFVRTGQPVDFRNSDDTLHNVHVSNTDTREPAFNVAIPTGEKYTYTFRKDGYYHVGCDIHPAMSAEIFSSTSPFVSYAESDGTFAFSDVPPGPYVVQVYSPKGRSQQDVEVKAGSNSVVVQ